MNTITEVLDDAIEPRIGDLIDQTWHLDDEGTGLLYPDLIDYGPGQQDALVSYLLDDEDADEPGGRHELPRVCEEIELVAEKPTLRPLRWRRCHVLVEVVEVLDAAPYADRVVRLRVIDYGPWSR